MKMARIRFAFALGEASSRGAKRKIGHILESLFSVRHIPQPLHVRAARTTSVSDQLRNNGTTVVGASTAAPARGDAFCPSPAVTGAGALDWIDANERLLSDVTSLVKGAREDVSDKVTQLVERNRILEREVKALKGKVAFGGSRNLLSEAVDVGGVKVLVARIDGVDSRVLRETSDKLRDQLGSGVVVLGAVEGDKVRLVAGVSKDLTSLLKAGELISHVAECVGGKGGGRADFAQAGGTRPDKLDEALALVIDRVSASLD